MGNQLTGIAPSQILPVEHYLQDYSELEYVASLGSTRFLKVALAKGKEGRVVVKVFVIHDPSLPLTAHRRRLEEINTKLRGCSNCLPFQKAVQSDKSAMLFREYVRYSLYDRISTRPFLNTVEKKWIAFQLLCALNQCHKLGVCHGDIKSENVMITSWNWVRLTDFASFKPTSLPEDNPSDFSYFFDTSRRRTCYVAPERFRKGGWRSNEVAGESGHLDLASNSEVKDEELTPAMDIFSTGCVIAELFTEGTAPFDLSQLLAYRLGSYSPWQLLEKIEDPNVRELVQHMTQRSHRLNAEEYMVVQRGKAFPDFFYQFLKLYMQQFAVPPIKSPDERIAYIKRDLKQIKISMQVDEEHLEKNSGMVIIISFVTSCCRSLFFCSSRLDALEILLEMSKWVTADIILDRILPYMLYFAHDKQFPIVRARTIHCVTKCLSNISVVPRSDSNVFPEYVFPSLAHLVQDRNASVRSSYAENIAELAESALRVLDSTHLHHHTEALEDSDAGDVEAYEVDSSYDVELLALQEIIQQKVVTLLSDPDNKVKRTMLESGITKLCVFFGRQKANDILLSHMITFLNDKNDWQLRGAFFDNIVGVAAYVGWQSSAILKPLLEMGLCDGEEFVIYKALRALQALVVLGLLQQPMLRELVHEAVPLLAHPGTWVRQGTVGFLCAVARTLNRADVDCNLLPQLAPYLSKTLLQLHKEEQVLDALTDFVPRDVFDFVVRQPVMEGFFEALQSRKYVRDSRGMSMRPDFKELNDNVSSMLKKLVSLGLQEKHESKLLALKDLILKLQRVRAGSSDKKTYSGDQLRPGDVNIPLTGKAVMRRHAELNKPVSDSKLDSQLSPGSQKKKSLPGEGQTTAMNSEWMMMYGEAEKGKGKGGSEKGKGAPEKKSMTLTTSTPQSPSGIVAIQAPFPTSDLAKQAQQQQPRIVKKDTAAKNKTWEEHQHPKQLEAEGALDWEYELARKRGPPPYPFVKELTTGAHYAMCRWALRTLVHKRREQYAVDVQQKDVLDGVAWDQVPPPDDWRPKGILVAHLPEHRGAVNRIQVCQDGKCFATCSNDGTVKLWTFSKLESRQALRSQATYNLQGGRVVSMAFCDNNTAIAAATDSNRIHIVRINAAQKAQVADVLEVDRAKYGHITDLAHYDSGAQSVLIYSTVFGQIVGHDLRAGRPVFELKNKLDIGVITTFVVHQSQTWLALGTGCGHLVCWDLRFRLPINSLCYPDCSKQVAFQRLALHPNKPSWVVAAARWNSEVSMWDMETRDRTCTLWPSHKPPLSTKENNNHSVHGLHVCATDTKLFVLTGGTDKRIRFWDVNNPPRSYIVSHAFPEPRNKEPTKTELKATYKAEIIDGTEVIRESLVHTSLPTQDSAPDPVTIGHCDTISDVSICQGMQFYMISASRDGVVKVWK